jgi:UDP-N-acetylglucosamine:LPS N-acetylglucosamine transferase
MSGSYPRHRRGVRRSLGGGWRDPRLTRRPRILILTAAVGEGHAAAARALADDLSARSAEVEVEVGDALAALGGPLRLLLLDAYRWQLRAAPWIFGVLYALFSRSPWLRRLGAAALVALGGRSLLRFVDSRSPDVVVSTYPAATAVLGRLKSRGRLACCVQAVVTDIGGLAFWAHSGVDVHYVMDEACVVEVGRLVGGGRAKHVYPLVGRDFLSPPPPGGARRALAIPNDARLIVISGGGWGVGDLAGAVRAALTLPQVRVVCLSGQSAETRRRVARTFADDPRVAVWGFTGRMSTLLSAANVLVHSTGGVTCLEAFVCGCAVVAYGAPPGHARVTARTMSALGLVAAATTPDELVAALAHALDQPRRLHPRLVDAPSAAELVLATTLAKRDPARIARTPALATDRPAEAAAINVTPA